MDKRGIYESFKKIYNRVQGVKTTTDFQETGKLTPFEFVEAGDELLQKIPVWSWAEGPEDTQPFLPPNKKYLVYRGAPSYERAPDTCEGEEGVDEDEDENEGDWVMTSATRPQSTAEVMESNVINWDDDDDDDSDSERGVASVGARPCRLYDVYMVYDQYYQTPRVFLIGYAEDHVTPLTREEMMQDVYAANREKTVSIDPHPFLEAPCISIHPCRHAETMKRMICHMKERFEVGEAARSGSDKFVFPTHKALLLFLKFISSVVPGIECDVSTGVDV
ncbi:autophagocytosis associated protein [Trypanosoma vivax]|nr:autophagocytosis associated protein [Trypanosoma vivax]